MQRRLILLLAPLLLAGPASAAEAILPGYWETTNRLISPIPQKKVEMRCITPKDVAKFMEGPSNRHYTCTYPTKSFAGGKILLKGQCVSKKGRKVDVAGTGEYTPTTMKLTAQVATEFAGLNIAGRASTEARRVSDTCPETAVAAKE
jgi:hypothetical protein